MKNRTTNYLPASLAKALWLTLLISCFLPWAGAAHGEDTTERLRTTVARMNQWLGSGPEAQGWRQYLDLNVLDSQTAKGEQADPAVLRSILNRFQYGPANLQEGAFLEVRKSIKAHIEQIERTQTKFYDLQSAAREAVTSFKKPKVSELESQRDTVRQELAAFKNSYRQSYGIKARAEVFHKLKLNETIEFLSDLEIEMPPEISVGKLSSMIADETERLEDVSDMIDELPLPDEPPEEDTDEEEEEEDPDDFDLAEIAPPGPDTDDGGDDLESLEHKKEAIEKRIDELRERRSEILKDDRPRQLRRRDIGRELRRTQKRFKALAKQRTDAAFVATKKAVDRFADAYVFATEDNIQEEYLQQVSELAKLLPDLESQNARSSQAKIGDILHWLESRQQLKDLRFAIRRKYSSPNAYVSISTRMLQGLTTQTASDCDRVAEDFLGRFARGLSRTNTTVNLVPVDNPDQIQIGIVLDGTVSTNTYVRERSFRIDSSASGCLSAQRELFANVNGLYATPTNARAHVTARFGGIDSRLRLVQRLAEKSFSKEQDKTNAESTRRVQERLETQFDAQTSTAINDGANQLAMLSVQARELAAFLPEIYFRSFSQRIEAVAKKDTRFALAANTHPSFRTAGSDAGLRLHESMLSNYLDAIFAGRSFTKADFEEEFKSFGFEGDLFPEPEDGDEEIEDFKITFAKVRPIQLLFSDNELGVRITGSRFEQGDNSIEASVTLEAKLRIVNRGGKLILEPAGLPEINLAEDQEPDAGSIAFAKILEDRIAEALREADDIGFELPANLIPSIESLGTVEALNSMQLGLLELTDGWLYLGWNWQGGIVSTPAIKNTWEVEHYAPPEPEPETDEDDEELSVLLNPILETFTSGQ